LAQIASGMNHSHQHGLIHGDLKPQNIVVSQSRNNKIPRVKITDFGLSRMTYLSKGDTELIDQQMTFGKLYTKAYAAPEQEGLLAGIPVGKLSDIFSFGLIAIELVTGKTGFKEEINYYENFSIIEDKLEGYLLKHNPGISRKLINLIKKCLRIKPSDRYESFEHINRDLRLIARVGGNEFETGELGAPEDSPSSLILLHALRGYCLSSLGYPNEGKTELEKAIKIKPGTFFEYGNM
jgi:serine/threonine-protein kinase